MSMTEQQWLPTALKAAITTALPAVHVWQAPAPEKECVTLTVIPVGDEHTATGYRYITKIQMDVMSHGANADIWDATIDGILGKWIYEDTTNNYRVQAKRISPRRGYEYQPNGDRLLYSGGTYEFTVQKLE